MAFKNPKDMILQSSPYDSIGLLKEGRDPADETYGQFQERLQREPNNDEYREWLKPKIGRRVKEYRDQKLDEEKALAELMDEFGYEDLVKESYYGRPKRTDVQVWKDRANKYAKEVGSSVWPFAKNLINLNDDDVQEMIDLFGFNRKGEW